MKNKKGYDALWNWFGLSRSSWLTLPRVLMHEMPDDWQRKMAKLLEEYDEYWDGDKCAEKGFPNNIFVMEGIEVEGTWNNKTKEMKPPNKYDIDCGDRWFNLKEPNEWLLSYRHPDYNILDYIKE